MAARGNGWDTGGVPKLYPHRGRIWVAFLAAVADCQVWCVSGVGVMHVVAGWRQEGCGRF